MSGASDNIGLAVGLLGLVVGCSVFGYVQMEPAVRWVAYAALFLPYVAVVWHSRKADSGTFAAVAGTAVACRTLLIPVAPTLSDDIYRYVWDGRVAAAGINPFEYAPAAEELRALRDEVIWPAINHADVPTIYPPVAQYLFELNAYLGGTVGGMKLLLVLVELLCLVVAIWWCRSRGVEWDAIGAMTAAYALNPLVIVEVAHSGHVDVVAWSLLALALVIWQKTALQPESEAPGVVRSWTTVGAVSLLVGLSVSAKFLSILALPFLLFDSRKIREAWDGRILARRLCLLVGVITVVGLTYLPYASAGGDLFDGFGTYAGSWRSNDGGYRAVQSGAKAALYSAVDCPDGDGEAERIRCDGGEMLVSLPGLNPWFRRFGWTKKWQGETIPDTTWTAAGLAETIAKGVAVFVVGLVMLGALVLRARPAAGVLAVLVALYVMAPVVHPWYVAWLVPLTVVCRRQIGLIFSGLVLLGYFAWWASQTGGSWHVPTWVVAIEYSAVLAAAWWELVE